MVEVKLKKRVAAAAASAAAAKLDIAKGCWSTASEKLWLDKLGTHRRDSLPKATALAKYIENSKKRMNWGMINKEEVLQYAKDLLLAEGIA